MIKYLIVFAFVLLFSSGFAQSKQQTREEYIQKYYPLAISEMERSGIPASIKLAQGCWESANGNSRLATEAHNHFGIKCKADWKGKKIFHDDDEKQECFRKYSEDLSSYIDHSNFLMAGSRYAFLFQLDPLDYAGWARGLKKAGYATDPTYAERLIKIIEDYKLYQYDQYGANRQIASLTHESGNKQPLGPNLGRTNATHKIELRNGLRTIVAEAGDTYESLTAELNLKDWELYTYNDMAKGRQPHANEILYIEAKHKKADKKHTKHVAESDDTMHYISQRYALKLKPLLRRNRMEYGEEPQKGQIIYLRTKKPRKG